MNRSLSIYVDFLYNFIDILPLINREKEMLSKMHLLTEQGSKH